MGKMISKETLKLNKPVFVGVSGPSKARKDYLTSASCQQFNELGIMTKVVQMTTERPDNQPYTTKPVLQQNF